MSSESAISLCIPSTSPVRALSLLLSSVPSTSPLPELEVTANYRYIGADHCGVCCLPLQYDYISWHWGLIDGHTCQCGRTTTKPSVPDNTPEEAPTPQLAHCMLPMHEDNDDNDSEINYKESNKENQPPIPPPGFMTNNPDHPFIYHIYVRNPLYCANKGYWTHERLIVCYETTPIFFSLLYFTLSCHVII